MIIIIQLSNIIWLHWICTGQSVKKPPQAHCIDQKPPTQRRFNGELAWRISSQLISLSHGFEFRLQVHCEVERTVEREKGKMQVRKKKEILKFCSYLCTFCTEDLRLDRQLIVKVCKKIHVWLGARNQTF